jgi:hypothetical protein
MEQQMYNSVAKKIFAVGMAGATALMAFAPFAAHAAVHAAGTNVLSPDGTVSMISTDGTRRPYTSAGAFLSYGFNSFASTVTASPEDLALPTGAFIPPQDGSIICSDRGSDKGTCYFITAGQKAGFTSASVFTGLGFSFSHAKSGDVSFMPTMSTLINSSSMMHLTGALINKSGTVYLVGPSGLLGIPDLNTFNSWGYSFTNVVPANAADMVLTQTGVMAMRVAGQLSPSWTSSPTCTSNCTPVVNGSVTAQLSSDTPAAGTIVAGQSIADLAHFTFTGNGTVTQVVLKRIGVSADATLSNVYLYNGNNKLTDAGSVSNTMVTFSNASGLFTVNGSLTVSVKSDILTGSTGQTVGVQLASFSVASGSPVSTTISGNTMTIATASLASVQLTATSTVGSTINAGTMNTTLWGGTFSIGTRNVWLKYLALRQIGSVPSDALQNLKLYVAGSPVGSVTSVNSNGTIIFDLTASPVTLQTGSQLIEVRGDVVKGSSRTFSLQMQTASDMVVVDSNYNVNIAPTLAGGFSFPITPGTTTVNQGSVSVQTDSTFIATQAVKNAANVTLGQWTMKAYGEDVKVQTLGVMLTYNVLPAATEGFNNLTLYVNGGAVGSSQSAISPSATSTTYTFGTTNLFTIPAGTQVTLAVKGDMTLVSSTAVSSVRADLVVGANSQQGITSFNTFPTGATTYTGTTLTISSSSVTTSKNTAYANQTISSNLTNQRIGSFVIQASNAEDVRITSLTAALSGTMGSTPTNLANLYVKTSTGSATPVNPSSSNNFSVDFTIQANQTATVDVYADVTNATGTIITTLTGSGTGKGSGQSVSLASTVGQTITVGNGTLSTPTLQTSSPIAQFVIGGSVNQPVATFNFVASTGGATIQELDFNASSTVAGAITSVTVAGVTAPVVGASSTVTGLNIAVPTSFSGIDVPVTVNYSAVGLNGIASNAKVQLVLSRVKFLSGSTTAYLPVGGTFGALVSSNVMDLVGSAPTITLTQSNNTLTSGATVGSITITANAAGNIVASSVPFSISANNISSVSGNLQLIDASSGQVAGTATFATGTVTVLLTADNNITAGTSKTYNIVLGTVNTVSGANNFSVTVGMGAATGFLFKDVNGNTSDIPGAAGGSTFIVNYPTNTVTSHQ